MWTAVAFNLNETSVFYEQMQQDTAVPDKQCKGVHVKKYKDEM